MTTRLVVGPFNRVEGDLEVRLELAGGAVREAFVTATMYRGFEQMLPGRDPMDALTIVPRICGICSLSQSLAAARALAALAGVTPPPNGVHALNLMSGTENLADHLTHFYLFFMPDFARDSYAARPWFGDAVRRFAAGQGEQARRATAARARWFTLMGTLGGKWPHSGSVGPGGSSRPVEASERLRLAALVREFRSFVEEHWIGGALEEFAALADLGQLDAWRGRDPARGDLRFFLSIARDLELHALGRGPGRLLSYGAFPLPDDAPLLAPGLWHADERCLEPIDDHVVIEDARHAWLADGRHHPFDGRTEPLPDKPGAYTWNKAPRWNGQVVETGALARQVVAGQPLLRDAMAAIGANVTTRVLARAIEVATVLPAMERWLAALAPREPFVLPVKLPDEGRAPGRVEAARGALGHWIAVERGKIARYQIVAPTSWNFSPRDGAGTPGALEAALVGTPVDPGAASHAAVNHVVRSFDPCMVCTVH